jgi:ribosome-associated protein
VDDLRVAPGPGAPEGLTVPARELAERFSHSSGPGGQGVNTADSRVQLSLDLATTTVFDDGAQRARAIAHLRHRLADTVLTVDASEERSQRRNRTLARERMAVLLREAVVPPVPRRPTKRTKGSQRRRLERKHQRGEVKQNRRRPTRE